MISVKYTPGAPDFDRLLLQWHHYLTQEGPGEEMTQLFTKPMASPLVFLNYFVQPRTLVCGICPFRRTIDAAYWCEPGMDGAYIGYWVHPAKRHSNAQRLFFAYAVQQTLKAYPVLISTIRERDTREDTEKFIALHLRMGYQRVGAIPQLFNGRDAHVLYLTQAGFDRGTLPKLIARHRRGVWVEERATAAPSPSPTNSSTLLSA